MSSTSRTIVQHSVKIESAATRRVDPEAVAATVNAAASVRRYLSRKKGERTEVLDEDWWARFIASAPAEVLR